jgi:hypothetical protein
LCAKPAGLRFAGEGSLRAAKFECRSVEDAKTGMLRG